MVSYSKLAKPVLLVFILGCSSNSGKENVALQEMIKHLEISNNFICNSTERIFYELDNKLSDPFTSEKAGIWYPKAKELYDYVKDVYKLIDTLKSNFERVGVKDYFISKKKGDVLFVRLKFLREKLLNIDSSASETFKKDLIIMNPDYDTMQFKGNNFSLSVFGDISKTEALSVLVKYQNNVCTILNKYISYFNNKVVNNAFIIEDYSAYSAIATQSSSIVKPQETIIITSGVGSFTKSPSPNFLINGREVEVNGYNQAVYKFKASSKPGKHFVPLKISYTDQDGKRQVIEYTIEYTVSNCKN